MLQYLSRVIQEGWQHRHTTITHVQTEDRDAIAPAVPARRLIAA